MMKIFTLLLMLLSSAMISNAQYTPAVITSGFNHDVIANGAGTGSVPNQAAMTITSAFDIPNNFAWLTADYQVDATTAAYSNALPISGTINSAVTSGLSYQMADYNLSNVLLLSSSNTTGLVTVTNATNVAEVYLLTAGANAGTGISYTATIWFSDFTFETFSSLTCKDWFNQTGFAINNLYRVNTTNGAVHVASGNPRLYETKLTLSAASVGKTIDFIDITATIGSTSNSTMGLFAVTTSAACTGTPVAPTISGSTYVCSGSSVTFTATNPAANTGGVTYEWQTSPAGLNSWSPTANTGTSYTTTITSAIDIQYVATCNGSMLSSPSNLLAVTINPICYCAPSYTSNCTFGNKINNVTIGTYTDPAANSVCAPTTTPSVPLFINTAPNITVITGGFVGIKAAIDLAIDGDLNTAGDDFYTNYISTNPSTHTFTMPVVTTPGTYRLRIWCAGANAGSGTSTTMASCDQYVYGNYRDYDLVYSNPLSITLSHIEAHVNGKSVLIDWKIEKADKGDFFELERSVDNIRFEKIVTMNTYSSTKNYSYVDEEPYNGVNYYRLKMMEANGNFTYSKIVSAAISKTKNFYISPNPAKDFLKVEGTVSSTLEITIVNSLGQTVKKEMLSHNIIDVSKLSRGTYFIKLSDKTTTQTVKFFKE